MVGPVKRALANQLALRSRVVGWVQFSHVLKRTRHQCHLLFPVWVSCGHFKCRCHLLQDREELFRPYDKMQFSLYPKDVNPNYYALIQSSSLNIISIPSDLLVLFLDFEKGRTLSTGGSSLSMPSISYDLLVLFGF